MTWLRRQLMRFQDWLNQITGDRTCLYRWQDQVKWRQFAGRGFERLPHICILPNGHSDSHLCSCGAVMAVMDLPIHP